MLRHASTLGIATLLLLAAAAGAAPLTLGNIIATADGHLLEYTRTGALVQRLAVPNAGDLRSLAIDSNGLVQIYNGTFTPQLTAFNPANGSAQHTPFPGWSTVNNVTYGGVGTIRNWAFVTDMSTAGAGQPNGLIRFDVNTSAGQRFTGGDYTQLNVGHNGLLYGLSGSIQVFDPESLAHLRTINLSAGDDYRGIAVNAAGDIFALSWGGFLYRFDANGNFQARIRLPTQFANFAGSTVNLTPDGWIVAAAPLGGSTFAGRLFVLDESFNQLSFFDVPVNNPMLFANWVQPTVASVPEPGTLTIAAVAGFGLWVVGRRRRR